MRKFKVSERVEFIDKNPGSTGLSHTSTYEIVGFGQMKDSQHNWINAVLYKAVGHEDIYVRAEEDFNIKFKIAGEQA